MSYVDKDLACRDCSQTFVWTAGEQEFYASRGLLNEPGRCPHCRAARRSAQAAGAYSQTPNGWYGGGYREMFSAICSSCGKEARVPFELRDDRPIYCFDCLAQVRGEATERTGFR